MAELARLKLAEGIVDLPFSSMRPSLKSDAAMDAVSESVYSEGRRDEVDEASDCMPTKRLPFSTEFSFSAPEHFAVNWNDRHITRIGWLFI